MKGEKLVMTIFKRNGEEVAFDSKKIVNAINKANKTVKVEERLSKEQIDAIASEITDILSTSAQGTNISVEEIQNLVETKIQEHGAYHLAKHYIKYRYEREIARNEKTVMEKLTASNVQNQNANVDEHSFGGRMGETVSYITKKYALEHIVPKKYARLHNNNEIYIHDLDSYSVGMHNCLSIPFDKLLSEGFNTRQCDIRPAGSINTAMQLVAVIFQLQSLQQFGGVSATHLDWTMVPYVRLSFWKHYWDGRLYINGSPVSVLLEKDKIRELSIEDDWHDKDSPAYKYAMEKTIEELNQAVEGMYHNLNTLQSRSGNQLPFTSINYGTCTLPEGRMVIKALLEGSIKGVGKFHKTPIFPCGIFQCMKGVNRKPGDPNYDLFKLALKSTALRLYPNYANVDWSGNEGYDRNNPQTYFSTMGALGGHEHLYIKINDGDPIDISIKDFFNLCNGGIIKGRPMQLFYNKQPLAIPTSADWRKKQNRKEKEILDEAGVYKVTYIPQDVSYIGSSKNIQQRVRDHKKCIRHKGGLDSGVHFNDTRVSNYRFEVLEYTEAYAEAEKKYISTIPNINIRGTDTKYYKNVGLTRGKGLKERPSIKMDPNVPQDFIDLAESNIKVLDRGNRWVKVNHVFRNDKMNTPLMMHISYREFDKEYTLCCTEDHPLWTGKGFTEASKLKVGECIYRGDGEPLKITKVFYCYDRKECFDIGTETGSFIGSDIIMHNCRTANGYDINADDPKLVQLKDGRGNICPISIIMPTIAMQAKKKAEAEAIKSKKAGDEWAADTLEKRGIELFLEKLEKKIYEAKDMLIARFEWVCSQSPKAAKFMYENGTMYGYKPEEGIRSALKHGTLAVGQLGLAETLQILIGTDHTTAKGMKLAKRIESLFKTLCAMFKEENKLNFGVYYTPAENLCYTAMKKFKDKYGEIPKVSDRDYFTNSMHCPVWAKLTPFEKIDIEAELTGYSSAGCITYVELDASTKHNLEALETLVNYAMDKDIPYFAINVPNDTCEGCGYTDEIGRVCPKCGCDNIQRLRRVTGYLTGSYKEAFNIGKQHETEDRVKHSGVEA